MTNLGDELERLPARRVASPAFLVALGLLLVTGALMAGSAKGAVMVVAGCAGFYGLLYGMYNRGPRLQAVHVRGLLVRAGHERQVPWTEVTAVARRRVVVNRVTTIWYDIELGRSTSPDALTMSVTGRLDGAGTTERVVAAIVRGAGLAWSGDRATRAPATAPAPR